MKQESLYKFNMLLINFSKPDYKMIKKWLSSYFYSKILVPAPSYLYSLDYCNY